MSEAPLMLGVSGLRGIVGKSLTPEVAARFAGAFGAWLTKEGARTPRRPRFRVASRPLVVVGRDGRMGGEVIARAATAGLAGAGCNVVDLGVSMTPTVGVMVDAWGAAAGLVVTASHNPQEWNGLKLLVRDSGAARGAPSTSAPGATLAASIIERFRQKDAEGSGWNELGEVVDGDSLPPGKGGWDDLVAHTRSVSAAMGLAQVKKVQRCRFPVVLDSVNASGRILAPILLGAYKCRVTHQGAEPTGLFSHPPEPLRENLGVVGRATRKARAAVGFAQDPDADRLAIIDERGEYIGEEYTLALAAEALLGGLEARPPAKRGRVLVANLSTSRMIDDIAAKYGARVVRTAVGEANVVEAMKREKAAGHDVVLGGEGNGGVIWPPVTYVRDSLSAMALVLALMARTGKKVSELVAAIPAYAIEKRKVDLARKEDATPAVEKIAAAYRDQKIDRQDGVRVDWVDRRAWLHVRASNTEPIMRLIAEAPTEAEARTILDEAARIIAG
jgi:phosphomannomutase